MVGKTERDKCGLQGNCSFVWTLFSFVFFFLIFQLCETRKHLVYSFRERSLEDSTLNEWWKNCLCSPKINQQNFFRCFHCKLLCTSPHEKAIKQAQIIYLRVFCFNLYPILFTIRVNSLNVSLLQCYCQCNGFQLIVKLAYGMEWSRERRLKGTGTHTERLIWQLSGVKFFHSSASIVHLPFSSSSTHDNNITWRPGRPANVVQLENVKIAQTEKPRKEFWVAAIHHERITALSLSAKSEHNPLPAQCAN